jgi:hypothetical protein
MKENPIIVNDIKSVCPEEFYFKKKKKNRGGDVSRIIVV